MSSRNIPLATNPVHEEEGKGALGFTFNHEGVILIIHHHPEFDQFPDYAAKLNSHVLATVSGGTDVLRQCLPSMLHKMCQDFELAEKFRASAEQASRWLAKHLALYPGSFDDSSLEVLIAGWHEELGPAVFKVGGTGTRWDGASLATGCASRRSISSNLFLGYIATGLPDRPKYDEQGTSALGFIYGEGIMVSLDHSIRPSTCPCPDNSIPLNSHLLAVICGGTIFDRRCLMGKLAVDSHFHKCESGRRALP
ncbi:OLC1v1023837C1 [Oldenlandia corymbosa var. corymbosa]|uniref:OLC1v1023837C1 n=1 Tax=Oldenlandia corymbosa var. corymbosa TaxID=529605 RepID=A0AAV1C1T2_OLDCO|nr:OLC1v1023837C1 [Oldenlandia corymbosa var. corymbosa]